MRLVIGLGNPGDQYAGTRHNIGFSAVDIVASRNGISLSHNRFSSTVGTGRICGSQIMLAKPQTYMNLSGRAVRQIVDFYKLNLDELLVVHDDMDVELGRIKVVAGGGTGGHNGVASIAHEMGATDFARIKIGVGRPRTGQTAEDYVLNRFRPDDLDIVVQVTELAAAAVETAVSKGVAEAQSRFNRKDLNVKEEVRV